MCIKSHRYLCLQILLLILLLACLIIFASAIFGNLGFYLLTSSAAILQDDDVAAQSAAISVYANPTAANAQTVALFDPSTNTRVEPPQAQASEVDEIELPLADWLMEKATSFKCSWFNSTVQSGQLLQLCDDRTDPFDSKRAFAHCFRISTLYEGLALLLPALLVFLSTIAVCRLLLCPVLTLAIIYFILSIVLIVGAILFNEGVVINNLHTEEALPALFHVLFALVILYTVLALLHILLYALVSCEQRRLRQNGDSEKIMKQSTDDEDDIDDPKAPLYEDGFSPQKKNDFEEKIKEFKYIDDDMSYIFRKG